MYVILSVSCGAVFGVPFNVWAQTLAGQMFIDLPCYLLAVKGLLTVQLNMGYEALRDIILHNNVE